MAALTLDNLRRTAERLLADGDVPAHPTRITLYDKAMAWIEAAPRDAVQLGVLLDISTNHAATVLWDLRRWGKVEPTGPISRNGRPATAYRVAGRAPSPGGRRT